MMRFWVLLIVGVLGGLGTLQAQSLAGTANSPELVPLQGAATSQSLAVSSASPQAINEAPRSELIFNDFNEPVSRAMVPKGMGLQLALGGMDHSQGGPAHAGHWSITIQKAIQVDRALRLSVFSMYQHDSKSPWKRPNQLPQDREITTQAAIFGIQYMIAVPVWKTQFTLGGGLALETLFQQAKFEETTCLVENVRQLCTSSDGTTQTHQKILYQSGQPMVLATLGWRTHTLSERGWFASIEASYAQALSKQIKGSAEEEELWDTHSKEALRDMNQFVFAGFGFGYTF